MSSSCENQCEYISFAKNFERATLLNSRQHQTAASKNTSIFDHGIKEESFINRMDQPISKINKTNSFIDYNNINESDCYSFSVDQMLRDPTPDKLDYQKNPSLKSSKNSESFKILKKKNLIQQAQELFQKEKEEQTQGSSQPTEDQKELNQQQLLVEKGCMINIKSLEAVTKMAKMDQDFEIEKIGGKIDIHFEAFTITMPNKKNFAKNRLMMLEFHEKMMNNIGSENAHLINKLKNQKK